MHKNMANNVEQSPRESKRDIVRGRLEKKHPGEEYTDDDVLYDRINSDYDDYDNRLKGYEEREQKLSEMFTSDPRSAAFLLNWRDGADPVVELIRRFGPDIADAANDPERIEAIAEASKEYIQRVAKDKELQEQYEANLDASLQTINDMQEKDGVSDDDIDAAMAFIIKIVNDGLIGRFEPGTIHMALKAVHHDKDVKEAADNGEIRGRNAKIGMKLRAQSAGDGVPQINGGNNTPKKRAQSIFDIAADAR